jgi:hypothetical protein
MIACVLGHYVAESGEGHGPFMLGPDCGDVSGKSGDWKSDHQGEDQ